jgi:hypothetical protein
MKIEMRGSGCAANPISIGGTAWTIWLMRPSAGAMMRPSHGRHARRVAEEISAPDGQRRADPAQRWPQPKQHEAQEREAADERIALRMDGHEL